MKNLAKTANLDTESSKVGYRKNVGKTMHGVIILDRDHVVRFVDPVAEQLLNCRSGELLGNVFDCTVAAGEVTQVEVTDDLGETWTVEMRAEETEGDEWAAWVMSLHNITEQERTRQDRLRLVEEIHKARKLEAIGSLTAGIAHEINTPIQFIGDNIRFLADSFEALLNLTARYDELWQRAKGGADLTDLSARKAEAEREADIEYIREEIPQAIEQTLEGVHSVTGIVRAMKDFAHQDQKEKTPADLHKMLESTLTVARNELKYVADVEKDFDPELPLVECFRNDLNQVFLNLLINAAHAIGEVIDQESGEKGTITVSTRRQGENAVIKIADTGAGIPEAIKDRILDPFFTTKEVGRGTGQGLAIARSIVVDRHGGKLSFETEEGKGTTFTIELPVVSSSRQGNHQDGA